MSISNSDYADASARCERAMAKMKFFFVTASALADALQNVAQRSKLQTIGELTLLRQTFDQDLNIMERCVIKGQVPGVETHEHTRKLAEKFDDCYYELTTAADVLGLSTTTTLNRVCQCSPTHHYPTTTATDNCLYGNFLSSRGISLTGKVSKTYSCPFCRTLPYYQTLNDFNI